MKFVLTIDVPDHVDIPARYIAQALREIGPLIEPQNPLVESFNVRDRFGVETASWEVEQEAARQT